MKAHAFQLFASDDASCGAEPNVLPSFPQRTTILSSIDQRLTLTLLSCMGISSLLMWLEANHRNRGAKEETPVGAKMEFLILFGLAATMPFQTAH